MTAMAISIEHVRPPRPLRFLASDPEWDMGQSTRHFKLRLFKHLKFARSYSVAVGQPAYPTPSGLFSISEKQIDPVWSVPNSPWAGELGGTTVAGGMRTSRGT